MRVLVTGGAGFVGSNVVTIALERGHDVTATAREEPPCPAEGCRYAAVDLLDSEAVAATIEEARPDAIMHTAIWNDLVGIYADRQRAWGSYVGVTEALADGANAVGAALLTVSTDWVFDGTQSPADEETPPNPVNLYGVLKLASEMVTLERARDPLVARVAGVMGAHRAGRDTPRAQDAGFGYFVEAVVTALESNEPFVVWESPAINCVATPSLASLSAEWMLHLLEGGRRGVFHCCGAEAATRMGLARKAAKVFGLDAELLRSGAAEPVSLLPAPIPYDTSLDARATARAIGAQPPSLTDLLARFRDERATLRGLPVPGL